MKIMNAEGVVKKGWLATWTKCPWCNHQWAAVVWRLALGRTCPRCGVIDPNYVWDTTAWLEQVQLREVESA